MQTPEHLTKLQCYEGHQLWLRNESEGVKANLRWADLRGADLRWANLHGANLHEADLRWADLRWADLRWADLREADLREADLCWVKGFHLLTQTDHGYLVYATWRGEWRVIAGCRDFSVAEARVHWGSPDYHLPSSGSRIAALLDWLEQQPAPEDE